MNMKDKISEIIKTLTDATMSNQLVWVETDKSSPRRGHYRNMAAKGEDGTIFEVTIEYKLSGDKWQIEENPSLYLKNKDLPGGSYFIYGGNYDIKPLRELIKSIYCKDMNPVIEDVIDTLDGISKGISLSTLRDGKLNTILKK